MVDLRGELWFTLTMTKAEAIKHFGGSTKVAKALGITKQAVYKWPEELPEGRQFQIEILTQGKLKAERRVNAV